MENSQSMEVMGTRRRIARGRARPCGNRHRERRTRDATRSSRDEIGRDAHGRAGARVVGRSVRLLDG